MTPMAPTDSGSPDDTADSGLLPQDEDEDGWTEVGDCDDTNALAYPGATEVCDGLDNDCDGSADEGIDSSAYVADEDEDGYGAGSRVSSCVAPSGFILAEESLGEDCNDEDATVNPGSPEINSDGQDNNCNGLSHIYAILSWSTSGLAFEMVDDEQPSGLWLLGEDGSFEDYSLNVEEPLWVSSSDTSYSSEMPLTYVYFGSTPYGSCIVWGADATNWASVLSDTGCVEVSDPTLW